MAKEIRGGYLIAPKMLTEKMIFYLTASPFDIEYWKDLMSF